MYFIGHFHVTLLILLTRPHNFWVYLSQVSLVPKESLKQWWCETFWIGLISHHHLCFRFHGGRPVSAEQRAPQKIRRWQWLGRGTSLKNQETTASPLPHLPRNSLHYWLRRLQVGFCKKKSLKFQSYPLIGCILGLTLIFRLHGKDNIAIKRYVISFWNGIDLRYKLLKGPAVKISIAGIIISRVSSAGLFFQHFSLN